MIEECPKDPNIKTLKLDQEIEEEYQRIQKIKKYRTLFADTGVVTTQMLKKCVLVPREKEEDNERHFEENPFTRGSMKFDDFNYGLYNPHILIEDTTKSLPADLRRL
jgi:hypothetical protein